MDQICQMLPDATDFEELPEFQGSSSAPVGGKAAHAPKNVRQNSKQFAEMQAMKKAKKQGQFINILNKFVGLDKNVLGCWSENNHKLIWPYALNHPQQPIYFKLNT